ncbi:nitroimidazol reductase NimA-like FMN-containing flavoprotein (pyridoxamine 5'-phosphate oxidase superfamily) [Kitasatospora sp. MAA4]|uniref:pyridoxamine 5'-phosphate oxidase family protein n=1 Tax=Kitasatospora sp. MAA4 TaxID=3035093 RepID=UPI002476947E|nr:pyridoxamine 5'-phosphate oxidase family protein [Kitasatospora sp. MAA4]MDH6132282.1 nitroimidazol reductase NimA-like FMN-containing flavoprotein (pyridoxamine 5'-phosphate oxidase superfamily) [Kitasatospora sp. MAA4]
MKVDRKSLDERQCLQLLASADIGRVVYTVAALPAVFPVRFRLDADGSVLLTAPADSGLLRAVDGAVIAFEAGEVDRTDGRGWTVTVLGRASPVTDPPGGEGGVAEPSDRVRIRIRPGMVTGRMLDAEPAG